ncbi:hypothetical protein HYE82_06370 [Streptomyces sp. BR123]|nr:hypothetical protein [Streptomyces sp. BR123]
MAAAEAAAEWARRAAVADAVRLEGDAEAAAIAAKGTAEAAAMQERADAFERYGEAATLQMLVEALPQIVAKAAEPLGAIDKMTVISTDGATKPTRTVTDNVAQGVEPLGSTTGIDRNRMLCGLTAEKAAARYGPLDRTCPSPRGGPASEGPISG